MTRRHSIALFLPAILSPLALQAADAPATSSTPATSSPIASTEAAKPPAQPPPYSKVRWDEDYSYLQDPAQRNDPLDALKYMPLNDAGDIYLSLGGELRDRYEYFNHTSLGSGPQDRNGYDLFRFLPYADLHVSPYFRAFIQLRTADEFDRTGGPRSRDADNFDLQQGFIEFDLPLADQTSLTLRGGRQQMVFGKERLIGISDFSNAERNYDGFRATLNSPHNTLDLFWVRPVEVVPYKFDNDQNQTSFAGVYDTIALPGALAHDKAKLSLYALALNVDGVSSFPTVSGSGSENRYTFGTEFTIKPGHWDFDIEADYQCGEFQDQSISAFSIASEAGYTFVDTPLEPRAFLGFDLATGDRDSHDHSLNTFNQLFPSGHTFFGYIDLIGRQNIIDLHPGIEITFLKHQRYADKATLKAEYHQFWRETIDDAIYDTGGNVFRAANGSASNEVGSEIDLLMNWQFDRHLSSYVGYSHFFAGRFFQQTGSSKDTDFIYAALVYTF